MAEGLKQNGQGKIITCEPDKEVFAKAKEKIEASGLKKFIDFRCESSLETRVAGIIDVRFCDSLPELRDPEVRHFLPLINLMHDASSHLKTVREGAKRMEDEGLISVVFAHAKRAGDCAEEGGKEVEGECARSRSYFQKRSLCNGTYY